MTTTKDGPPHFLWWPVVFYIFLSSTSARLLVRIQHVLDADEEECVLLDAAGLPVLLEPLKQFLRHLERRRIGQLTNTAAFLGYRFSVGSGPTEM